MSDVRLFDAEHTFVLGSPKQDFSSNFVLLMVLLLISKEWEKRGRSRKKIFADWSKSGINSHACTRVYLI